MQKFCQTGAVQAVVTGTAVSGVAVSLLRVITKAALPDTAEGLRRSAGDSPYLPTCSRIVSSPAPSWVKMVGPHWPMTVCMVVCHPS